MGAAANTDDVLGALARFRTSDTEMHQRVRSATHLGENELRILQLLLARRADGSDVMPSEISRHLGISSASTTALIDRLERQGSVERHTHPTDRRSILIAPTELAVSEVASVVDVFDERVEQAIDSLGESGRAAVVRFLSAVTDAADEVCAPGAAPVPLRSPSYA